MVMKTGTGIQWTQRWLAETCFLLGLVIQFGLGAQMGRPLAVCFNNYNKLTCNSFWKTPWGDLLTIFPAGPRTLETKTFDLFSWSISVHNNSLEIDITTKPAWEDCRWQPLIETHHLCWNTQKYANMGTLKRSIMWAQWEGPIWFSSWFMLRQNT